LPIRFRGHKLLWFIITTWNCNLNCIYCGNEPAPYGEPQYIRYDIDRLKSFISQDNNPIIAFYGGEPLIAISYISLILDLIPSKAYILQTNGTLIHQILPQILKKFDTILVSIDGQKNITDYYRGAGVYDTVIKNVEHLRNIEFKGDIIARMTISGESNIYRDVTHLINLNLFDHIHWQLDVFFDAPPHRYQNFDSWLRQYNRGIKKLYELWLSNLKKGKVLGLVPFQGILKIIMKKEKRYPPCGAGFDSFSISTSGKIFACPISPSDEFYVGNIFESSPSDLIGKIKIGEPCTSCNYLDVCGGRCLYANKTMLWGEKMFDKVCSTTKFLIDMIKESIPTVDNLVVDGVVSWDKILYPKYNNTTEIIP